VATPPQSRSPFRSASHGWCTWQYKPFSNTLLGHYRKGKPPGYEGPDDLRTLARRDAGRGGVSDCLRAERWWFAGLRLGLPAPKLRSRTPTSKSDSSLRPATTGRLVSVPPVIPTSDRRPRRRQPRRIRVFQSSHRFPLEQDYQATLFDDFDVEKQYMALKHEFSGVGPTLAVDMGQSLGFWGLQLIASGRGSVLFGHLDSSAEGNQPGSYEMVDAQHAVGTCEAEIGVQWKGQLQYGLSAFARCGYEGQVWLGTASPNDIDGNLMFEGLSVAFGLTR
jgi:hypothetical protein